MNCLRCLFKEWKIPKIKDIVDMQNCLLAHSFLRGKLLNSFENFFQKCTVPFISVNMVLFLKNLGGGSFLTGLALKLNFHDKLIIVEVVEYDKRDILKKKGFYIPCLVSDI